MNLEARTYPDIVRDLLTGLTGGTVAEVHQIGLERVEQVLLDNRPVRRVSHLQGEIESRRGGTAGRVAYRFTERDFELIPSSDNPAEFVGVRFREDGATPAPLSTLTVNYYPVRLRPTPLTDVTVGSVVRTLLETVAREMATQYEQLRLVYESGFVGTAKGVGLENVAALVGVQRLSRGHPVAKVRVARRPGSPGEVNIPISTVVTDGSGNRYLTSDEATMLPTQSAVEVWVHGESVATALVDANALSVLERALAGVDSVANDEPSYRASDEETDAQLADRARRAIHGTGRGTVDAIRFAVEALPFVSAVSLTELVDGMPGTLQVDVALSRDSELNRRIVKARVDDYRPAGIDCRVAFAGRVDLVFEFRLVLAGAFLPTSEVNAVKGGITERLAELVGRLAPGATLRRAQVVALTMEDPRVVDAQVMLRSDGTPVTDDAHALPQGKAVKLDPATGVQFTDVAFEEGAGAGDAITVDVDAELAVYLVDPEMTLDAVKNAVRNALDTLLSSVGANGSLTFEQVLAALGAMAGFVLVPLESRLQFQEEAGAFTELRQGDPPYTVPANGSLRLRDVEATPS